MLYFNEKIVFKLSPSCVQVENYLTVPHRTICVFVPYAVSVLSKLPRLVFPMLNFPRALLGSSTLFTAHGHMGTWETRKGEKQKVQFMHCENPKNRTVCQDLDSRF